MSFSFDVKEELCRIEEKSGSCKTAQLYGMVLFGQVVEPEVLRISTENVLVINHLQELCYGMLQGFFEMDEVGVTYTATLHPPVLDKLYRALRITEKQNFSLEAKGHLLHSKDQLLSFLRGAVLSGGYFSDPLSSYHFELVTPYYTAAKSTLELLKTNNIPCKMVVRRSAYVIYLKDSQQIYDLLYRIGARSSAFELMNIKIEKETNNNNNRVDNCTAYNMEKALNKSVEQVRAIEIIKATLGLSALPEDLRFVAILRYKNPTASLTELAALSEGRISKASLSRKLNKIIEFANSIKENHE